VTSWSADLVERRRGVRVFIICAAALYGGLNALLQIAVAGNDVGDLANTVNAAVLACVVAAIVYAMMRVDGADLFPVAAETGAGDRTGPTPAGRGGGRPEADRCPDAADGRRAHLSPGEHYHRRAGDPAENPRIQAASADQPAARLSQFQRLPQRAPDRGSQGG